MNPVWVHANPNDQGNYLLYSDGTSACEVEGETISIFPADSNSIELAQWFSNEEIGKRQRITAQAMAWAESKRAGA